ncbi:MAG: manganese catalase family protein [Alistipes sp.]|nr:manganese catalase family protein [Alistipes sp.]
MKSTGNFNCLWRIVAEQKARTTYDNILRLADDPDVRDPIKFLRQREIVHFQRFGEALRLTQDRLDAKNFYACNPSFDKNCGTDSSDCGCNNN